MQDRLPPSREGRWQLRTLPVTAETGPKRSHAPGVRDGPRRRARPAWQRRRHRSRGGDLPKALPGDRCSAGSHREHTPPTHTVPRSPRRDTPVSRGHAGAAQRHRRLPGWPPPRCHGEGRRAGGPVVCVSPPPPSPSRPVPGRCPVACVCRPVPPQPRCGTGGPGPLRPRRTVTFTEGTGLRERARPPGTVPVRSPLHATTGLTMAAAPGAVRERRLPSGTAGPRRRD